MNPPTLNDLCHRAEALAQDLRTLQDHEKPEKWAAERAAHARGEPVQWKWAIEPESAPWRDLDSRATLIWNEMYQFRIKPSPEWTPKFKVGDRVRIKNGSGKIYTIEEISANAGVYVLANVGHYDEDALEPYVWTLSRHIPGFRPLEEGEQWHREDFTEAMLPEGWRPLLKGECFLKNDELDHETHDHMHWTPCDSDKPSSYTGGPWFYRTRRPIPDTERERFERTFPNLVKNKTPSGIYSHQPTQYVWEGWQAARKAQ